MSLNKELKTLQKEVLDSFSPEIREELITENQKLFSDFLYEKVLTAGSRVPDVMFRDKNLETVSLSKILEAGPVVLSFYRGTWCPYCNLELLHLAGIHKQVTDRGAQLIAVSPELYRFAEDTINKNHIDFPVYTDLGNHAATKFGLVFDLPPKYREIHEKLGIYLNVLHGEDKWLLPVPATFIISKDGVIRSTYVNADYTTRMEPEDILKALDKLSD